MDVAQRLATISQIDLAVARSHATKGEQRETIERRCIHLGEVGKRGLATYVELFLGIGGVNGVKFDIAHNSTRVYAYGLPSAINTTETLYQSLVVQMVAASSVYLRSDEHRNDTHQTWDEESWEYVERRVHGTTARLSFQRAFAARVAARLRKAARAALAAGQEAGEKARIGAQTEIGGRRPELVR